MALNFLSFFFVLLLMYFWCFVFFYVFLVFTLRWSLLLFSLALRPCPGFCVCFLTFVNKVRIYILGHFQWHFWKCGSILQPIILTTLVYQWGLHNEQVPEQSVSFWVTSGDTFENVDLYFNPLYWPLYIQWRLHNVQVPDLLFKGALDKYNISIFVSNSIETF